MQHVNHVDARIEAHVRGGLLAGEAGGSFVVSTLHPSFATTLPKVEKEDVETAEGMEGATTAWSINLGRYKTPFVSKGVAIIGQPEPQYYFHRPLEYLLVEPFEVGWVLDALEEPTLTQKQRSKLRMMWETLPEIPPVLVMRFRRGLSTV